MFNGGGWKLPLFASGGIFKLLIGGIDGAFPPGGGNGIDAPPDGSFGILNYYYYWPVPLPPGGGNGIDAP